MRVMYVNHAVLSNLLSNDGNQLHVEIQGLTDLGDEIYLMFVAWSKADLEDQQELLNTW